MREFSKLYSQFWIGRTGKQIRRFGLECQIVALYLLSAPTANPLGLYYLPKQAIAHETGLDLEVVQASLQSLAGIGFCAYDELAETVFVFNMARYQIGGSLKLNDGRVTWVKRLIEQMADSPFYPRFYELYGEPFQLIENGFAKPLGSPSEGPSKPLRSIETENEIGSETKIETKTENAHGEGDMREDRRDSTSSSTDGRPIEFLDPDTQRAQTIILDKRKKAGRSGGS
jgi:hypothetical protein